MIKEKIKEKFKKIKFVLGVFLILAACIGLRAAPSAANVVDADRGVKFRLASPIHNLSPFKVWTSRFLPEDALPEHMTRYFHNLLRDSALDTATLVDKDLGANWPTRGFNKDDVVIKLNLEDVNFRQNATLGSRMYAKAFVRMTVYHAITKKEIFTAVVHTRNERWNADYVDILDKTPIFWKDFEKTIYWVAIQGALDEAFKQLVTNYTGYRIEARIVAVAVPAPGAAQWEGTRYHITLGRNNSLKIGDIMAVTRASSADTIDDGVMLYPQIIGKVRVVFLHQTDGVVEVIEQPKHAPIEQGDTLSVPIFGKKLGQW